MNLEFNPSFYDDLTTDSQKELVGGFSSSFSSLESEGDSGTSNNCLGGNCDAFCGAWQNIACNNYKGCN
ncbi:hypothetical protein GCM10022289_31600 [Pedobacter jeongneungensis]|uniref:Natural product n=1 Tax=Pedobacter jeongneungensis TaxID=947309 RepID=A0ABP8BJ33_9SPHI